MAGSRLMSLLRLEPWRERPPTVAVVRLSGVIAPSGGVRGSLSMATLAALFHRAFNLRGLKAVALQINSPGGSPVQSALIASRIRALAAEKNLPVYAFVEDVAASGGYWLATAADEIYADPNSVVGSIGVISASFGFEDFISRHGIKRRVHTSGEHKAMLDPFQPEIQEDVDRLEKFQAEIHDNFKQQVRARRGPKLKADESMLFSGEFWSGAKAKQLGLIDGLGDLRSIMRQHYGERVRLHVIAALRRWMLARLFNRTALSYETFDTGALGWHGADFARGLVAAIEERAWWSRYGL
jgi:signal peptide peptidase SppA